jgi:hypothetical protein
VDKRFASTPLSAQLELYKLYSELAKASPADKTPAQYVSVLERAGIQSLVEGTRIVVRSIAAAAQENAQLPDTDEKTLEAPSERSEDDLFEFYVRKAAGMAIRLPKESGARSFLLGLGVGLDRTTSLREHRLVGPLCDRIESQAQRKSRLNVLGVSTAHARHELARHFVVAAALSTIVGPKDAEQACLALQLRNRDNPGDFNPAHYQADLAGIVFAYRLLSGDLELAEVAETFVVEKHLPAPEYDAAALSPEDFERQYQSVSDPRFRKLRAQLAAPIRRLAREQR